MATVSYCSVYMVYIANPRILVIGAMMKMSRKYPKMLYAAPKGGCATSYMFLVCRNLTYYLQVFILLRSKRQ
jgi:hypothetical protein